MATNVISPPNVARTTGPSAKAARIVRGVSTRALAAHMGVTPAYVRDLERLAYLPDAAAIRYWQSLGQLSKGPMPE